METYDAILNRRSIRKFLNREISKEQVDIIINAAIQAPSAKNRQPWKFIIITGEEKAGMMKAMHLGIENIKQSPDDIPFNESIVQGAEHTAKIMEQAPVTVFVFNTEAGCMWYEEGSDDRFSQTANIQSIGAAIQNMCLAATDAGLGSLWICDIFLAHKEISGWLDEKHQLIAAVSFGYPEENPSTRPRKEYGDIVIWR